MRIEKPKRKRKQDKHSFIRSLLIALIVIPTLLFAFNPNFGHSLFADGIALSVMICAAVYIVQQGILSMIAAYFSVLNEADTHDTPHEME